MHWPTDPVAVVDDDCVGCGEVDAEAACARADEEHKNIIVRVKPPYLHMQWASGVEMHRGSEAVVMCEYQAY